MNIPLKYEDVVENLDAALGREADLREELATLRESYESMRDRKNSIVDLQQRLTVAERRESEAREELLELSRKLDVFYSRSHGIKNLSEIEKANDEAKNLKLKVREYEVLLNISKELLTTISRHGATTKPVDWCDSFKAEVAGRIEKIGAALKPAADAKSSPPCPNCKVCMGSPDFPENCLINGVKP